MTTQTGLKSKQGVRIRETIPLVAMKRAVADHMMTSHQQVPSVSVFADIDVDALAALKTARLDALSAETGTKITFTHVVIKAVAMTLRRFPLLNATIADGEIQVLDEINIGMAVALPDGNLVVPVIRDVDTLSVVALANEANRLALNAVAGKMALADVRGGTFTLSNVGSVPGTLWQTPLVNHPQCGILALGRMRDAAVVRDGRLAIGKLMGASLSFDHRIISGLPASEFMAVLSESLQSPEVLLEGGEAPGYV